MTRAILTRSRFPVDMVERLDTLAAQVGESIKRRVPRSVLVRALVFGGLDAPAQDLSGIIMADTVKRGRARSAKGARHEGLLS